MGVIVLILYGLFNLQRGCVLLRDLYRQTKAQISEIRAAIQMHEVEWNRLPIPQDARRDQDLIVRTRDPFLTMLIGKEGAPSNSLHGLKLLEPPPAKNRQFGLWRDGTERVLSDPWGEPYYIVLDANVDSMVANPEFGADQSNYAYAAKCKANPSPATLPFNALIYSSGPDRDPKTWQDNICSWR
ncbi:hypothetical protein [Prosthecobacter sp.]|uniref:hypothetical protein n=1 Tax=Prosthecobacter sp. TaxID=1965333 RepID=UPI0037842769